MVICRQLLSFRTSWMVLVLGAAVRAAVYLRKADTNMYVAMGSHNEEVILTDDKERALPLLLAPYSQSEPFLTLFYKENAPGDRVTKVFSWKRAGYYKMYETSTPTRDYAQLLVFNGRNYHIYVEADKKCMVARGNTIRRDSCNDTSAEFDIEWDLGNTIASSPKFIVGKVGKDAPGYHKPTLKSFSTFSSPKSLLYTLSPHIRAKILDAKFMKKAKDMLNRQYSGELYKDSYSGKWKGPRVLVRINLI